jgi:hypothetical protein
MEMNNLRMDFIHRFFSPTQGGLSTHEEMCLVYLTVYPRPALAKCQSEPDMPAVFLSVGVESFYPETDGMNMSTLNRSAARKFLFR